MPTDEDPHALPQAEPPIADEASKKKKKKKKKWKGSKAKQILHDALAKGEDERGNKVSVRSGKGQYPRDIYKLFKDLPEFQESDFGNPKLFGDRLRRLRESVLEKKCLAVKDLSALKNTLEIHPIPDKRIFVYVALPSLRVDMDNGLHLTTKPRELHKTRPEYQEFELDTFRKHIHQEVYTRKATTQYKWKKGKDNRGDDLGVNFPKKALEVDDDDGEDDDDDDSEN